MELMIYFYLRDFASTKGCQKMSRRTNAWQISNCMHDFLGTNSRLLSNFRKIPT